MGTAMLKWEYHCIPLQDTDYEFNQSQLNRLGKSGWELVTTTTARSRVLVAILKRPIGDGDSHA